MWVPVMLVSLLINPFPMGEAAAARATEKRPYQRLLNSTERKEYSREETVMIWAKENIVIESISEVREKDVKEWNMVEGKR